MSANTTPVSKLPLTALRGVLRGIFSTQGECQLEFSILRGREKRGEKKKKKEREKGKGKGKGARLFILTQRIFDNRQC